MVGNKKVKGEGFMWNWWTDYSLETFSNESRDGAK